MQQEAINYINEMSEQAFLAHIQKHQKEADIERRMQKTQTKAKKDMRDALRRRGQDFIFRCFKCDAFAVLSDDIKVVQSAHHVINDLSFNKERVIIEPMPRPEKFGEWEHRYKIYCKECKFYWGVQALYRTIKFSVIKIENFVVNTPHGDKQRYKKWKECPFFIERLSVEDLDRHAAASIEIAHYD